MQKRFKTADRKSPECSCCRLKCLTCSSKIVTQSYDQNKTITLIRHTEPFCVWKHTVSGTQWISANSYPWIFILIINYFMFSLLVFLWAASLVSSTFCLRHHLSGCTLRKHNLTFIRLWLFVHLCRLSLIPPQHKHTHTHTVMYHEDTGWSSSPFLPSLYNKESTNQE